MALYKLRYKETIGLFLQGFFLRGNRFLEISGDEIERFPICFCYILQKERTVDMRCRMDLGLCNPNYLPPVRTLVVIGDILFNILYVYRHIIMVVMGTRKYMKVINIGERGGHDRSIIFVSFPINKL